MIARCELQTPFPVGPVNAYLLPGTVPTLVDCGLRYQDNQTVLQQAIREHLDDRVDLLLLTHGHIDHIGLAGWVQRTYGCEVRIHPADRRMTEDYPGSQAYSAKHYRRSFLEAGLPEALYQEAETIMRGTGRFWEPVQVDGPLIEGERITAGDTEWRISHHPGHSPGMVCLRDPEDTALAGDLLIPRLTTIAFFDDGLPERGLGLVNHLQSLERLAELAPARVGPGHRDWIEDPAAELREQFAAVEARLTEVSEALGEQARTPWELVPEIFGELPDAQGWLALSDLLGALEVLEFRGCVSSSTDDGQRRYRR